MRHRKTSRLLAASFLVWTSCVAPLAAVAGQSGADVARSDEPREKVEAQPRVEAATPASSTVKRKPGETFVEVRRVVSDENIVDVNALNRLDQQPGTTAPTFTPAPSANTPAQGPPQGQPPVSGTTPPTPNIPQGPPQGTGVLQPQGQTPAPSASGATGQSPAQPLPTDAQASPQGGAIPSPQGPRTPGRESVPTAAPEGLGIDVPPVAQGYEAVPAPFPELGRVGVNMGDQRPLSLREAIELALGNNKDIEVARTNVRAAEFDLQGAQGVYDPRFSSTSYYERTETPAASFLSGGAGGAVTQSGFFGTGRFEGLSPKGGGGYRVDLSSSRVTTNNQFVSLNPQYPASLTFSYTQPLLRGLRFDQNRRLIEIANKNLSLTDAQFRQRAIEVITNVQRAYWDLVFALRNLQVQRDAVRDARAQLEHNKRLVEEGMLAPIDVVAAEAQISGFEQSVYSALDDVGRAENNLKNLIAENRQAPIWNVALVPTDPVDLKAPATALPDAMEAALRSRPEVRQSEVASEINEIDRRYFREQTKPQVDIIASYGLVGLAGSLNENTANPLTGTLSELQRRVNELSVRNGLDPLPAPTTQQFPEVLVGGIGQSYLNLAANRFTNFRVGVQLNLPIRNRTAQAQLGRALVEQERIATQREQLEQLIQVDVRNALQLVRTAESRLRAAAAARTANEQQYASEQRKFEAGQSTVFLVLERQTALTIARGNELRAQTELNKAIAELQRATGNTLSDNRVEVRVR